MTNFPLVLARFCMENIVWSCKNANSAKWLFYLLYMYKNLTSSNMEIKIGYNKVTMDRY